MEDKLKQWVDEHIFSKAVKEPTEEKNIYFRTVNIVLHKDKKKITKTESRQFLGDDGDSEFYIDKKTIKDLIGQKLGKTIIVEAHWGEYEILAWHWVTIRICIPEMIEAVEKWCRKPIQTWEPDEESRVNLKLNNVLNN